MAVGANDMRLLDEIFEHRLVDARRRDFERSVDAEAGAVFARADADAGGDLGVVRNLHLFLAGDEFQRAEEAGGIAGGEHLLGIGAGGAVAAEFLRNGQRHIEHAIV
ncbi:hypothetical protein D3C72_1682330 [compost metagenome]